MTNRDNYGDVDATMTAEYVYDVNGDRIATIVDADGAGAGAAVQTNFVVLDNEIILEFNYDSVQDESTLTYRYMPGPSIDTNLAIEEMVVDSGSLVTAEVLWSLADQQGTVRDV